MDNKVATRRRLLVTLCDSWQPDKLVWLSNRLQKMAEGELEDQRRHGEIH